MTRQTIEDTASEVTAVEDLPTFISTRVLPLLGERANVLHTPWADAGEALSGSDMDCAVSRLDPMWPLRLPDGWRLCQALRYDSHGCTWVLERDGQLLHVDTLDDPAGLGRYGFPTRLLTAAGASSSPGVYAAYLAVKRLRKGDRAVREWERIGRLASQDPSRFLAALTAAIGKRPARSLYRTCLDGSALDRATWRRLRWRQRLRRVRTPWRLVAVLVLGARRIVGRTLRPTGFFVLVGGSDGSGKSTLAASLPSLCGDLFRRHRHWHWRPELLPRLGALVGHERADPSAPHARPPRGRTASRLLLAYYWIDYLLGGLLWIWPLRARAGLLINERGWWDVLVDPQRYRLQGTTRLARLLGRMLPHPDLTLALEAPPEVLIVRKAELELAELVRQAGAFMASLPLRVRTARVDVSRPVDEVRRQAREEVLCLLERRAVARLGAGWCELPGGRDGRLLVPRGPRLAAREAMRIRPPRSLPQVVTWHAAWLLGSLGAFRLLPRGAPPPKPIREALAAYLPPRSTVAVVGEDGQDTYVALVVDERGRCHAVARVAVGEAGAAALHREAMAIARLGRLLRPPLSAPTVLVHEPGLLLLQAALWRPHLRLTCPPLEVAAGLGRFFRAAGEHANGPAHGACAPWNLLRTRDGWELLDWRHASASMPPFYDLAHYVLRAAARRGRPSDRPDLLGAADNHQSPVGRAIRAYAAAAGIPSHDVPGLLVACAERVSTDTDLAREGR